MNVRFSRLEWAFFAFSLTLLVLLLIATIAHVREQGWTWGGWLAIGMVTWGVVVWINAFRNRRVK